MKLKLAAIQLVSNADIDYNISRCKSLILEAASRGAKLLVLPENALTYGAPLEQIQSEQQRLKSLLAGWAQAHGVWIVAGSLPWVDPEFDKKPSASCFVFDDKGEEKLHYRKMHLFDADLVDATGAYRESNYYSAGNVKGVFETPWGKFGVAICYDLRFPEYFRSLAKAGVTTVFIPAAFTYVTGEAHWEVLLRARAIENQMFVLAANQGGEHSPTRKTWGETMLVDPWGRVKNKARYGEGFVFSELNFDELRSLRVSMPVLKHIKYAE